MEGFLLILDISYLPFIKRLSRFLVFLFFFFILVLFNLEINQEFLYI